MALTPDQVERLAALLVAVPTDANPVPAIRASFPELSVSRCDAVDMRGEAPFRRVGDFDVFLVDTSNHCWRIIDDPAAATGVVLSPRD